MGLVIKNISGGILEINDLGLGLEDGDSIDIVVESSTADIAASVYGGDIEVFITSGDLVVVNPWDGTHLSIPDALIATKSITKTEFATPVGGKINAVDVDGEVPLITGQTLVWDASISKWTPTTITTLTNQEIVNPGDFTTTSSTPVDIVGMSIAPGEGQYYFNFVGNGSTSNGGAQSTIGIYKDGVLVSSSHKQITSPLTASRYVMVTQAIVMVDGTEVITIRAGVSSGMLTISNHTLCVLGA